MKSVRKRLLAVAVILCSFCCASVAVGLVVGESNFGGFSYPAFDAVAPVPPEVKTLESARQYRQEVEDYIKQVEAYAEAARNDVTRINEEIGKAADKAGEATDAFNQWAASNN